MSRNLGTARARWRCTDPMAQHDRLPAELRRWLVQAALPWSAPSALKIWRRALQDTGCPMAARARLDAAEAAMLLREACQVWGPDYPPAR